MGLEFSRFNTRLGVGNLPGRKLASLYLVDGSTVRVLAYFRSRGHAEQAADAIATLMGLSPNWREAVASRDGTFSDEDLL